MEPVTNPSAQQGGTLATEAVRAAYGWGRPQSWRDALDLLSQAASAGEPNAAAQLELVTQAPIESLLALSPARSLCGAPRIFAVEGFAPPGFSEWLIERSIDRLQAAPANAATGGGLQVRTALAGSFGPEHWDLVVAIMQERAARLVGTPVIYHEPPNTLSYEPGQEYHLHVDFIDPAVPQFRDELDALGQRIATIVTYLNDDFDGAETYFPDAGVKFRGKVGEAVVFSNVLPDGTPDRRTSHSALPPTRGRKWALSQWIRSQPFPYAPDALG